MCIHATFIYSIGINPINFLQLADFIYERDYKNGRSLHQLRFFCTGCCR